MFTRHYFYHAYIRNTVGGRIVSVVSGTLSIRSFLPAKADDILTKVEEQCDADIEPGQFSDITAINRLS